MRFPPSFIERLRSHFLLSEVIGKRIAIKKAGREYHALCPFHNEKTPSFTINDEKGFYHCFGCAAHGDTIGFIMQYEKLTYPETIEYLARQAGIPLPQPTREEAEKYQAEKPLYDVLEAAAQWFEKNLGESSGAVARNYLKHRGVKAETIRQYRIGYAPDERTALTNHLLKSGFSHALQIDAGLAIKPDDGAPYDRFRGRVMFPIRNASGKIVAFGGRLLAEPPANATHKAPKYLNSPETRLFKKGEMLFNLDLADRPAREKKIVVVMEGYMDVVMSAQEGINYAVATLGTAVTETHLHLLWQRCKEPVMCLDGDNAGKRAMMRAADITLPFLKPGYSLRFAVLPEREDPDSYVKKHGKVSFEKILQPESTLNLPEVVWEKLLREQPGKIDSPQALAALKKTYEEYAAKIPDSVVKDNYRTHFNGHLAFFRDKLWKENRTSFKNEKLRAPQVVHMAVQDHSAALDALAQRLLKTLLYFPALLAKSHVEESLSRIDISSASLDSLRHALLTTAHDEAPFENRDAFLAGLTSQLSSGLIEALTTDTPPARPLETIEEAALHWNETITAYEIAHLEYELQALQESVGQTMDEATYQRLVEIKQAIHKAQTLRSFAPEETDVA